MADTNATNESHEAKVGVSRINITEEDGIHKKWYEEARDMTAEKLPEFVRKLTQDYGHDYGTICHAIAAAAIAAAWAVEKSPQGGITGFQAGCIMWSFARHWMSWPEDSHKRLLDYEHLIYPQYQEDFRVISADTWAWAQKKAEERLEESADSAHPEVVEHWRSIVAGKVPFGMEVR